MHLSYLVDTNSRASFSIGSIAASRTGCRPRRAQDPPWRCSREVSWRSGRRVGQPKLERAGDEVTQRCSGIPYRTALSRTAAGLWAVRRYESWPRTDQKERTLTLQLSSSYDISARFLHDGFRLFRAGGFVDDSSRESVSRKPNQCISAGTERRDTSQCERRPRRKGLGDPPQ